jgi:hypothetical protein
LLVIEGFDSLAQVDESVVVHGNGCLALLGVPVFGTASDVGGEYGIAPVDGDAAQDGGGRRP